jgi:hypothetical protein
MWPPPGRFELIELQRLRAVFVEDLGEYAARRLRIRENHHGRDVREITTEFLGKATQPRIYTDSRRATARVVRFASWWDHFKAAYRRRWWMSWRGWEVRYVWVEETAVATITVEATMAAVFPHAQDFPDTLGRGYPVVWAHRVSDPGCE